MRYDWIFLLRTGEIQSQTFDEKKKKVIVSGPFDPVKLKRKLRCKACKYIKDIQIKPPEKPEIKPLPPLVVVPTPTPTPPPVPQVPGIPVGPYAPMVCCRPCYGGYPEHGICTRFGYEPGTCKCNYKLFSEEDPSCSIM